MSGRVRERACALKAWGVETTSGSAPEITNAWGTSRYAPPRVAGRNANRCLEPRSLQFRDISQKRLALRVEKAAAMAASQTRLWLLNATSAWSAHTEAKLQTRIDSRGFRGYFPRPLPGRRAFRIQGQGFSCREGESGRGFGSGRGGHFARHGNGSERQKRTLAPPRMGRVEGWASAPICPVAAPTTSVVL